MSRVSCCDSLRCVSVERPKDVQVNPRHTERSEYCLLYKLKDQRHFARERRERLVMYKRKKGCVVEIYFSDV